MKRLILFVFSLSFILNLSAQHKTFLDSLAIKNHIVLKQYKKVKYFSLNFSESVTFYANKIIINDTTFRYISLEFSEKGAQTPQTYTAFLNEEDWDSFIKAVNVLLGYANNPQVDLNQINIEYRYEASDGFEIGIFNEGQQIKWFFQLNNYVNPPIFSTNKGIEFLQTLRSAIETAKSL